MVVILSGCAESIVAIIFESLLSSFFNNVFQHNDLPFLKKADT